MDGRPRRWLRRRAEKRLGRLRPARPAGAARAGDPDAARLAAFGCRGRPRRAQVLQLRRGRGGGGARADLAHRLHRRGRLRALSRPRWRAGGLAPAGRGRRPAGRPGGARHAAPGGRHGALRPRDRRHHDALRGRARLGGQARQGGLPGPRRPRRAEGARPGAAAGGLRGGGAGHRPPGPRGEGRWRRRSRRSKIGAVTSGTWSPTFEKALGLAYVPVAMAEPGTPLALDVRGRALAAAVVPTPFYRRAK